MKSFFILALGFLIALLVPHQGSCQVLLENRQQLIPLKQLATFDLEIYGQVDSLLITARKFADYYKEQHQPRRQHVDSMVRLFLIVDQGSLDKSIKAAIDGKNIVCFAGFEPIKLDWADAIIHVEAPTTEKISVMMQSIFGGRAFVEKLKIERGDYARGDGLTSEGGIRLSFPIQDESHQYQPLKDTFDRLMQEYLDSLAFPGAQLMVLHKGKVAIMEEYGCHTYEGCLPVLPTDLYDMASVTKTTTATLALMALYDQNRIDLDQNLCFYIPKFCHSDKGEITLRNALTHQSGLKASIVFWKDTYRKNGSVKGRTYRPATDLKYSIKLSDHLYLHRRYKNKIYKSIRKSELKPEQGYVYSDLGFVIFPELIKSVTGYRIDSFMYQHFYNRLGADRLTFKPTDRFNISEIVPTELDTFFRHNLVQGFVHDESSAMLDGLSANAGLFANALDLAKICQMLLNKGSYGGDVFFKPEIVAEFTRTQFPDKGNRRALGFDKPLLDYKEGATYVARSASPQSFGHTGYTGTYYWIDPVTETAFILFTNRVNPTRANNKISGLSIRPRMLQAMYNFLEKGGGM
ncbi:MAG: serine hydrolase [Saprospiraceae bacterium]|nr:serine hydrolase [Saprospiraceae bacterium]